MFCGMRCVRRVLDLWWRRFCKAVAGRVFRHAEGIGKVGIIYIRCKTSAAKGVRLCRMAGCVCVHLRKNSGCRPFLPFLFCISAYLHYLCYPKDMKPFVK